jgi:hypothetical protein
MNSRIHAANAFWDTEAKVRSLRAMTFLESPSKARDVDALIKKLRVMVLRLLEANGRLPRKRGRTVLDVPFEVRAEYHERLRLQA